jgi:hypothetical protein
MLHLPPNVRTPPFLPLLMLLLLPLIGEAASPFAIEIDLSQQKAFLLQDGKIVYESPICSGRSTHRTPTGNFQIIEKDADHVSSLYGRIVDGNGKTLVRDADRDMPVPAGAKFVQAPMKNFMRFDGATGMHEGRLPGYPASHGCVRMPAHRAALFFDIVEIGTPVRVFGTAPGKASAERVAQPTATPAPTPEPRKWYQIFRRDPAKPTVKATPAPAAKVTPAPVAKATPAPARVAKAAPVAVR